MKRISCIAKTDINIGTEENPKVKTELRKMIMFASEDAFAEAYKNAQAVAYDGEVTVEKVPMTEEAARALRNKLLAETDWTELMDAALTTASKKEFRAYRQNLRNVPQQEGFPANIVWPMKPKPVKADPEPVEDIVDAIIGEEELE